MVQARSVASPPTLQGLLSRRAADLPVRSRLDNIEDVTSRISFIYGFPDPGSLPAAEVAAATARTLARNGRWALQYGDTAGYRGLIDVLLE